jgi:hypothetical protein
MSFDDSADSATVSETSSPALSSTVSWRKRFSDALSGPRHGWLSLLGMVSMAFDHVCAALAPHATLWQIELWRTPGRLAMPIFALLAAAAVTVQPVDKAWLYVRRLALLAVVSEIPYQLFFGVPINAVASLFFGAFVLWLMRTGRPGRAVVLLAVLAGVAQMAGQPAAALYAGLVVAFGLLTALEAGAGLILGVVLLAWLNSPLMAVQTWLAAAAAIWLPLPRRRLHLPRWLRYGFYPAHLLALFVLLGPAPR